MNADGFAGRLSSIMLIQVALLAFFQSKEEGDGKGARLDCRLEGRGERERGHGRRIGLNLSWWANHCRQDR